MKTFSQKMALFFAIINTLPAIFGIFTIWVLIPIPGLILYVFYWLCWRRKIVPDMEKFLWAATIVYNIFLVWLGKQDKDFSFEGWGIFYQLISAFIAFFALVSTFNYSIRYTTGKATHINAGDKDL